MNEEYSKTQMLRVYFPGLAWLPRFVRDKLTPALVGSAVTFLFGALAYVFNSPQKDIHRIQEAIVQQQAHEQAHDEKTDMTLQQLVTGLAVMSNQVGDLTEKADRNEGRWDRLADIAETPPHARRRPK